MSDEISEARRGELERLAQRGSSDTTGYAFAIPDAPEPTPEHDHRDVIESLENLELNELRWLRQKTAADAFALGKFQERLVQVEGEKDRARIRDRIQKAAGEGKLNAVDRDEYRRQGWIK